MTSIRHRIIEDKTICEKCKHQVLFIIDTEAINRAVDNKKHFDYSTGIAGIAFIGMLIVGVLAWMLK